MRRPYYSRGKAYWKPGGTGRVTQKRGLPRTIALGPIQFLQLWQVSALVENLIQRLVSISFLASDRLGYLEQVYSAFGYSYGLCCLQRGVQQGQTSEKTFGARVTKLVL